MLRACLLLACLALSLSAPVCGTTPNPSAPETLSPKQAAPSNLGLRGGEPDTDEAAEAAKKAQDYVNEQMEYWKSLSEDQQKQLLDGMSPEQRAATEAFLAGKPQITITAESLERWKALSKEEQEAQLATMTPEQQQALKEAVEGKRETVAGAEQGQPVTA